MQSGAFASVSRSLTMGFSESRHDYFSMVRPVGLEDLLQQIQATPDFEQQKALAEKISKLLYDDATFVPLYFSINVAFTQPYVHDLGRYDERQQLSQWSPQDAWISK
jgi:ABC-type transport system substrate-binding protein